VTDKALLPGPDEAVRCATHSRHIGLDPGGTALWADELIVADVALPWPKPVWRKPGFERVAPLAAEAGRRVRVLAAVPESDDPREAVVSVHRRPADSAALLADRHLVDRDHVADLVCRLLEHGPRSSPATMVETGASPRELLVCTQGSHDICCGTRGTTFAAAIRSAAPTLAVRRVSHTGGHRFAPTVMSLPDGRMWGLMDVDTMLTILDRSVSPAQVAGLCRGFTGVEPGPSQVAERAVMAAVDDWSFDLTPRSVEIAGGAESELVCLVSAGESAWMVEVHPGRDVPVIACGVEGGLPAKPGREWMVARIDSIQ